MRSVITDKTILAEEVAVTKSSADSENTSSVSMRLDRKAERSLVWKCDRHVLPIISLLFMLAFVDRVNIGNARIQGLEEDLEMAGNDFNIALFIFFLPYILLEVPSNLILKKIAPSTWLSSIMFCWGICDSRKPRSGGADRHPGIVTVGMGFTQSYAGLVICRFLLGVFEAGFVPGNFDRRSSITAC